MQFITGRKSINKNNAGSERDDEINSILKQLL